MPTVLQKKGFKFFFYSNDHPPPHIHVIKGNGWAKIEIVSLKVNVSTLKAQELKECLALIKVHQKQLKDAWYEWFNR